jgi:hypothetical protein
MGFPCESIRLPTNDTWYSVFFTPLTVTFSDELKVLTTVRQSWPAVIGVQANNPKDAALTNPAAAVQRRIPVPRRTASSLSIAYFSTWRAITMR